MNVWDIGSELLFCEEVSSVASVRLLEDELGVVVGVISGVQLGEEAGELAGE